MLKSKSRIIDRKEATDLFTSINLIVFPHITIIEQYRNLPKKYTSYSQTSLARLRLYPSDLKAVLCKVSYDKYKFTTEVIGDNWFASVGVVGIICYRPVTFTIKDGIDGEICEIVNGI